MTHDFDLQARLKTPRCALDLQALGVSIQSLALRNPSGIAQPRGSVYWVCCMCWKAPLWAATSCADVAQRLGLEGHNGCAFLYVYGEATGRQWKAFLEFLAACPWTHKCETRPHRLPAQHLLFRALARTSGGFG